MLRQLCYLCILLFLGQARSAAQLLSSVIEDEFHPKKPDYIFERANKKPKDAPNTCYDKRAGLLHATWTQFDKYKSRSKKDLSVIYYSASRDSGKTWTGPRQLNRFSGDCLDGDSTVKGPEPALGAEGELYVTWAGAKGLCFQRSLDTGKTWLREETIINPIHKGWSCRVAGVRTNGLPRIACAKSGEFKGRIYICWSDEKNGEKNKDVFLVYSDDKGEHWTEPILVTYRPNHKEQFSPRLRLDSAGRVYIVYFDRQNSLTGDDTDISLAVSANGGLKFDYYRVTAEPFHFNANYLELIGCGSDVCIRWMQPVQGHRFALLGTGANSASIMAGQWRSREMEKEMEIGRSFVYQDKMEIRFSLRSNSLVTAVITKPLEPHFEKVLVKGLPCYEGTNHMNLDFKAAGLKKGNYVLTLYYYHRNTFVWITEE